MNLIQQIRPDRLPTSVIEKGTLVMQREIILQTVLNLIHTLYMVGFAAILIFYPRAFLTGMIWLYLALFLGFTVVTFVRKIPYLIRAVFIILTLQALGCAAIFAYGLSGTGIIFLFASILLSFLFFNFRIAVLFTTLAISYVAILGSAMVTGGIPLPPVEVQANSNNIGQWGIAIAVLVFCAGITASSLTITIRGMNKAVLETRTLAKELELERSSLEKRVENRSGDLKKRVEQFEIASQIAQEIASENGLENLLTRAAGLIRDRFGFYHVGIFLNDDKNEYAVLRAATGDAGRVMLERGHRLKIGEIGMVGNVVSQGEARISLNVTGDLVHYKNPLLPETHSEMALPLRSEKGIIGALDVQSIEENAFTQEDIRILQIIADQIAIAFDKAQLVSALQRSVAEMEASSQLSTQKAWRTHLRNTRQRLAYRYHDSKLEGQVAESEHALEAQAKGRPVLRTVSVDSYGKPVTVLAVPIRLRNQVLGVVDIHFSSANVSPDLISLIEGTVNRLAVSLENARLLEEIQFRAERERLIGEISSKVRSASDVDSVMRIAIQEIGQSLGVSEVMVQLRKDS